MDSAPTPAAKANAQRAMAMSWAFSGDCKKTAEYEDLVIDYWKTQEKDVPDRAFYQQGEMADEAARVCIDNGDLETQPRSCTRRVMTLDCGNRTSHPPAKILGLSLGTRAGTHRRTARQ